MSVKILSIVFVFCILVSTILTIRLGLLTIKSVEVLGQQSCASSDQIKDTSKLTGQNIIFINSSKKTLEIKNKFSCVKDVQIARQFPNRVNIFLSERLPKALVFVLKDIEATQSASLENIATPSAEVLEGKMGLEVDEEGVMFAKNTSVVDIPKVYYNGGDLSLGQKVPTTVLDSLKILEKIKSFGLYVKESQVIDGLFLIHPKEKDPKIIFKLGENLEVQLASLQLILNQAKIGKEVLEFIDLRFDKPVVRLAPKKI